MHAQFVVGFLLGQPLTLPFLIAGSIIWTFSIIYKPKVILNQNQAGPDLN